MKIQMRTRDKKTGRFIKSIPVKQENDWYYPYSVPVKVKTDKFQKWVFSLCWAVFLGVLLGEIIRNFR
jgi:hypothetical protein